MEETRYKALATVAMESTLKKAKELMESFSTMVIHQLVGAHKSKPL